MKSEAIKLVIQARLNSLTKPLGSLGKLEQLVIDLGIAQHSLSPDIAKRKCFIFAADHGITQEGVSAYPSEVTRQMLLNFSQGGAAANILAKNSNTVLEIIDVGVLGDPVPNVTNRRIAAGTHNFLEQPAMSEIELAQAMQVGASFVDPQFNLFVLGEMGIGNTTSSAAIASAILKCPAVEITGKGAGLDDATLKKKISIIETALLRYQKESQTPHAILTRFAGFEIAAMVGFLLESRRQNIPVLIDGFIVSTAALVAIEINPEVKQICIYAHLSDEFGHKKILQYLSADPVLDLQMRLGEGSGALVALSILDCALSLFNEMATFESAKISQA